MKIGRLGATLCLMACCGWLQAQQTTPPATANNGTPKIKFDKTVYDFGKTSQVERVSGNFIIQNVGDGVLKIDKPTTSCGCTVAGVKPDVLQPGEKGQLEFTMNMPKYRGMLQKQITVTCNDPQNPKTMLTVRADYVPLFEVNPYSWYLLNVRKGDTTNVTARVKRTDGAKFNVVQVKPSQTNSLSWLQAKAEPVPDSTNGEVLITATIKPETGPRYYSDVLNGYTEGSSTPAFSIPVTIRAVGDLTLSRESLYWPITDPTRATMSQPITVTSSLAEKLEIKNLSSTLKDLTVEAVPKNDKTVEIVAKLASVPEQTISGIIRFETNVPSQPKVDLPVYIALIKPAAIATPAQSHPATSPIKVIPPAPPAAK
jgi:hypothetical protein